MASFLTGLLSDLASTSASRMDVKTEAQSGIYYIRTSPTDSSLLLIHASGESISSTPLYTVRILKKELEYCRTSSDTTAVHIGCAKVHQWNSSSADITLHGKPVSMAISSSSGHTKFESPVLGKMKWKADHNTGSGLILIDDNGRKVAKYGSAGMSMFGAKRLEMLVPIGTDGLEEVIFAAVVAKSVNKAANEAASKVLKGFVI